MSAASARIRVEALAPAFASAASAWAQRLDLPREGAADFALQVGAQGLQLVALAAGAAGPVRVDFLAGAQAHRAQFGGGEMIARAVGVQAGARPSVVDATAGLGRDAFVLARLGCALTLFERQPLIAALLADGLERAREDPGVAAIVARMRLIEGDAIAGLACWAGPPPQVVYLDPMFPEREKSALVKKEMRLFRPFAGRDDDAPALLAAALALASHRVVVKRPRKASAIAGPAPSHALVGKSSRFDVYAKRSLHSAADHELPSR